MVPVARGVYRGAQPKDEAELRWLKAQGIRTVIDLENEPASLGNPLGESEALWERDLCQDAGICFDAMGLSAYWPPRRSKVDLILTAMVKPDLQPILVHCRHGQDRTGLIVGMYRRRFEGWDRWRAWDEMIDHGFHPILLGLTWHFWRH